MLLLLLLFFLLLLPFLSLSNELSLLLSINTSLSLTQWDPLSNHCQWPGVTCDTLSRHVTSLNLSNLNLSGRIPPDVVHFKSLKSLDFSLNSLQGPIPKNLICMGPLQTLDLSSNRLSGEVNVDQSCQNLILLNLSRNSLVGQIPKNLIGVGKLETLDLSFNKLSGEIYVDPVCQNLILLNLSSNFLVGEIPKEIGRCTNLKALVLDRNVLEGGIPKEIGKIEGLRVVDVSKNSLTGWIPKEIGRCRNLEVFVLTNLDAKGEEFNAFVGGIPSEILEIERLEVLWAPRSNVDGRLVKSSKQSCRLRVLNLGLNYIKGVFPKWLVNCRELEFLDLSSNYLEGIVPEGLSVGCMSYFNVSQNSLSGSLEKLSRRSCLKNSILDHRDLIRSVFRSDAGNNVILHDFSWNNFSGSLPSLELLAGGRNFSYRLSLNDNELNESMSGEFFKVCRGLSGFEANLSSNQIPGNIWMLSSCLQLRSFEAANNKLSGSIPPGIGNLSLLSYLDLRGNGLSGEIPVQLGEMTSLKVLDLSKNSLIGEIPQSLENVKGVEVILLDHNLLSGEIPQSFSRLAHLATFDVSFNNLSGKIPNFNQSTNCDFFRGNKFLEPCTNSNAIVPSRLPSYTEPSANLPSRDNRLKSFEVAAIASASVIVCVLVILVLVLVSGKRKLVRLSSLKQKVVVLFSNAPAEINYESVVRATRNFSIQNLIGTGGFGATYKAELDPGFLVAVKRLSVERFQGLQQFDAEIRTLGRIRHKNLVTLIGYHMGEVDTFLIYNYLSGGNLEFFIRNMSSNNVGWSVIHKIALDVAQAIVYLHYSCIPRIVHRDIKPSNILLDDKLNAYLSDFGLARLLEVSQTHATTDVAGTFGYVAPEYATTCRVSKKADVYSFGVVLLELVSGKRSLDSSFSKYGNGFTIVSWGRLLVQEGRPSEFFCDSLRENGAREDLIGMLKLALSCTVESLAIRPSMKQVLETLKQMKS